MLKLEKRRVNLHDSADCRERSFAIRYNTLLLLSSTAQSEHHGMLFTVETRAPILNFQCPLGDGNDQVPGSGCNNFAQRPKNLPFYLLKKRHELEPG